jgi:AcrR family transcriptional regulator
MTEPETRLRADAKRNRDQIIAVAKTVFAESGAGVPMEEIARRAGVGVGTLYRRFPDRQALVLAVALENFASVLADARAAVTEEATAWDALVRLMSSSRSLRLIIRLAVVDPRAWEKLRHSEQMRGYRDAIMRVLEDLVRDAQAEGTLRPDVGAGDVAVLVSMLIRRIPAPTEEVAERIVERVLVLILDGLRASRPTPLPGEPITAEDLQWAKQDATLHSTMDGLL